MMRSLMILGVAAPAFLLAACSGGGVADRKRPDEFAIGKQAPLVIPPDYALAPPRPGAPRPLATDSQQQALEALLGSGVVLPPKSEIENRLLSDANAVTSDSGIRNTAGDISSSGGTQVVEKGSFLREVLDAPVGNRNADIARITIPGA